MCVPGCLWEFNVRSKVVWCFKGFQERTGVAKEFQQRSRGFPGVSGVFEGIPEMFQGCCSRFQGVIGGINKGRRKGFEGVSEAFQGVTEGSAAFQGCSWGFQERQDFLRDYIGVPGVLWGFISIPGDSGAFQEVIHSVLGRYSGFQGRSTGGIRSA